MTVGLDRCYCAIPPDDVNDLSWVPPLDALRNYPPGQDAGDPLDIDRRWHRSPDHDEPGDLAVLVEAAQVSKVSRFDERRRRRCCRDQ